MSKQETAILAGGCFWGMQDLIRKIPGVMQTDVGYTGGHVPHATYELVKRGNTGHAEAIRVIFDPSILSYRRLLEFFFQVHDPTTVDRQGNDRGSQYRSAIFYADETQHKTALDVMARVNAAGKWPGPVVTELAPLGDYWIAEDLHQDYLERHPNGYTCHWVRPDWVLSGDESLAG